MSRAPIELTAEQRFRQAFQRLKEGKTEVVERGAPVSQNNVAKEAGCDPSALRKERFPSLVREIQAYVEIQGQQQSSKRQEKLQQRRSRADLATQLEEIAAQRDSAQSQLLSAHRRIVELTAELKAARNESSGQSAAPIQLGRER
ncbi:hypothetical protein [Roseateles asaccharophilus]|jgi:hypothetical protein|uniref:KfrA N-terminal DNA-binding domain-containing protein n=1 Tax=Roseateles asaccharophilus TaxID=582607 RepID=A0ABU2AFB5_9BURK|nr:hypothetical protein [Roseateles asaccharophilus]MDR7334668.1 hypothetical protein [Roseateles asaccharophilus]